MEKKNINKKLKYQERKINVKIDIGQLKKKVGIIWRKNVIRILENLKQVIFNA